MIVQAGVGPCWTERPRYRRDGSRARRNVWHVTLMSTYSDAAWSWWQAAEVATSLHATEVADYARDHPRPQLRDFMVRLSRDWRHGAEQATAA